MNDGPYPPDYDTQSYLNIVLANYLGGDNETGLWFYDLSVGTAPGAVDV